MSKSGCQATIQRGPLIKKYAAQQQILLGCHSPTPWLQWAGMSAMQQSTDLLPAVGFTEMKANSGEEEPYQKAIYQSGAASD